MSRSNTPSLPLLGGVSLVLWLGLWGCSGAPPTDALQAAQAAIDGAAEAEDCAPEEYRAAVRLLEQANDANAAGDYDRARILAESAREQAERARLQAQANADRCRPQLPEDGTDQDTSGTLSAILGDYQLVPVYFGFDSSALDERARATLQAHAEFLLQNDLRILIEGHCDAEGTDSYNLALGESRARTARQLLIQFGVPADRLSVISYGEFRPASTEDSLNRRAEFQPRL
jgi:peptidoglycan-associated lipoprotein